VVFDVTCKALEDETKKTTSAITPKTTKQSPKGFGYQTAVETAYTPKTVGQF
jgi:hypothetical protein